MAAYKPILSASDLPKAGEPLPPNIICRPVPAEVQRRTKDQGYGRTSRQYELPTGELYDSVTSILGVIAKPALINWAANVERSACLEAAADLYDEVPLPGPKMSRLAYIATLEARLGKFKQHQKLLEKAGNIGSQAHAMIAHGLRAELGGRPIGPQPEMGPEAAVAWANYQAWREETGMTPLAIEQVVWSKTYKYAGTLDLFAALTHPTRGLVHAVMDWKTGKAIYPEARLQAAAYATALREMGHFDGKLWGVVVRLPKTGLDPSFEAMWIDPDEMDASFTAFLAAKDLWDWQQGGR